MNFVLLGCHCVLASCHSSACASWMSVFICVSGQQHTLKPWAGLAYATSSFPVVLVPCYFPGTLDSFLIFYQVVPMAVTPSFGQLFFQLCSAQSTPKFCHFCAVVLPLTVCCLFMARLFHAIVSVIAVIPWPPSFTQTGFCVRHLQYEHSFE